MCRRTSCIFEVHIFNRCFRILAAIGYGKRQREVPVQIIKTAAD